MRTAYLMSVICFSFLFIQRSNKLWAQEDKLFYHPFDETKLAPCTSDKCFDLNEIIKRTKSKAFTSRKEFNKLYQFAQQMKVKLGRLLPSFNYWSIVGTAFYKDPAAAFLIGGFIFPSNWFQWKESKLNYLAQRYSLIDVIANQVQLGEVIYYNLHREIMVAKIYEHYFAVMDEILNYMENHGKEGQLKGGDLLVIKALKDDMQAESLFIADVVAALTPELVLELALPVDEDWKTISIKRIHLPKIGDEKDITPESVMQRAYDASDLLKSLYYITWAAEYSKKSTCFEWMSPFGSADNSLGFSLAPSIKISKAKIEYLKIVGEEAKNQITYQVYSAAGVHNTAIKGYNAAIKGQKHIQELMDHLISLMRAGKPFDIHQLHEAIILGIKFDFLKNFSQHIYLLMKAKIRRFGKEGKYYKNIEKKIPGYNNKKLVGLAKRYEDKKIKRDIKNNKLKLLKGDKKIVRDRS